MNIDYIILITICDILIQCDDMTANLMAERKIWKSRSSYINIKYWIDIWIDYQEIFVLQSLKNKLYLLFKFVCPRWPNGCNKDHNRQMAALTRFCPSAPVRADREWRRTPHLIFPAPDADSRIHALISLKQSLPQLNSSSPWLRLRSLSFGNL